MIFINFQLNLQLVLLINIYLDELEYETSKLCVCVLLLPRNKQNAIFKIECVNKIGVEFQTILLSTLIESQG